MSKVLISDVAVINKKNIEFNKNLKYINYLDTSSITNNKIDGYQTLYIDKDKIPSRAKRLVKNNTIVYSSVRPRLCHFGILKDLPENPVVSTGFITIDAKEDIIDPFYLYYILTSKANTEYLSSIADTSVSSYPSINPSDISNMEINIIEDINEQKKIANILKAIEFRIENNNKINEELESMAKTIHDYWFLQFEFPNEEGKPYKSSGGNMVWNEELKREIPQGWKSGRFNNYIQNEKGGDWGKEEKQGNYTKKVTCIRGADFPAICGNQMLKAPIRYILKKNESKVLKAGDIIVEISGGSPIQSTGRVCYINPNLIDRFNTDIITSNFCKAFSLKNIEFTYWFYRMWQKLYDSGVYFNYESKTTGIKNLLFETLCIDYPIISPPEEIIKQYNHITTPIFNKIQKNKKENQELADLRDFLLPLLMNGQVGFRELALAED